MKIIFLVPSVRKPVGGVKVIYQQVAVLNQILPAGATAVILHPNTLKYSDRWFDNGAPQMRAFFKLQRVYGKFSFTNILGVFDPANDIVVIPEVWVRKYGVQLLRQGITYAIYVQNGYFMSKGDRNDLDEAYTGAQCVLTISDDASECVAMAFPAAQKNILRMHYSVRSDLFSACKQKQNVITYMPRKLPDHSQKVLFFLHSHLPRNWNVQPINGLNEQGVAQLLSKSKVFMSFSHFEGCPLPPLEAALSGNKVVGYTGQGGKEYWRPEIFTAIESGNVTGYTQAVLQAVSAWEKEDQVPPMRSAISELANCYSADHEKADLQEFVTRMSVKIQDRYRCT
jgi:hypothetical protein